MTAAQLFRRAAVLIVSALLVAGLTAATDTSVSASRSWGGGKVPAHYGF